MLVVRALTQQAGRPRDTAVRGRPQAVPCYFLLNTKVPFARPAPDPVCFFSLPRVMFPLPSWQILGEFGKEVLFLQNRMGFVKLALRNGLPLVPAYVFGANDTFRTSNFLRKTRLAIVKNLR